MEDERVSTVGHYLAVFRRRFAIVLTLVLVVPAVAVGYSLSQPDRFQATSLVLVNRQTIANQLAGTADIGQQQQSFQQILVTQARLARTPTVIRATTAQANVVDTTPDALRNNSTVEQDPNSDLLTFAVVWPDATDARRLAVAYAHAYVDYRRRLDSAALSRALADVDQAIADARDRGRSSESLVNGLLRNRQQLETRLALQTENVQVVAGPDSAPRVQPRPVRSGILGLIVGLVAGIGIALVRETLDTRVRSGTQSEEILGLPILSRISTPSNRRGETRGLVMLNDKGSAGAESVRVLRTNLSFGLLANKAKLVMVTSAGQGEGKSTTIANLAIAEALAGKRVALVELDLRRPVVGKFFDLRTTVGLTTVAMSEATLADALRPVDIQETARASSSGELFVLPAGPQPPDPGEFIATEAVGKILGELRETFDLVLIDAPPLIGVSETALIANVADAAFVCVRLGVARRPILQELGRALGRLQAPVLGQVTTGAEADEALAYYGYGEEGSTSAVLSAPGAS